MPQGSQTVPVRNGVARFDLTTNSIEVRLIGGSTGIGELRLSGVDMPRPDREFTVPCGQGPVVTLDGFAYETSVTGTLADFVAHRPMKFSTCADLVGGVDLPARRARGAHRPLRVVRGAGPADAAVGRRAAQSRPGGSSR